MHRSLQIFLQRLINHLVLFHFRLSGKTAIDYFHGQMRSTRLMSGVVGTFIFNFYFSAGKSSFQFYLNLGGKHETTIFRNIYKTSPFLRENTNELVFNEVTELLSVTVKPIHLRLYPII